MMVLRPMIVDEDNVVLGGNMRLNAIKALGMKEIPDEWVKKASELTDAQKKEFIIKDNSGFGEYDWDAIANEWSDLPLADWGLDVPDFEEIEPEGDADAEPQIDKAAELNKKWKVKRGDLWQIGDHRLLCGDSTKAEAAETLLGGAKSEMMFTDPPWNVAIGQQSNPKWRQRAGLENDDLPAEEFAAFIEGFLAVAVDVVEGDVYCVLGSSEWPTLDLAMRSTGFHWSATIIWVKHHFSIGRSKYHRRYEPIWYGWHSKSTSSFCDRRDLDDVWEYDKPAASEDHPTMKPVPLVQKAVECSSKAGGNVYEPFAGSGTTLVACQNLNRKCYAIEISENYCAVILQRMSDAFPDIEIKRIENGKA